MCKLFIATGSMTPIMVEDLLFNTSQYFRQTERDGFGFIACGRDGSIARGNYDEPNRFAGFRSELPTWLSGDILEVGSIPEDTTTLIIHGRTSTGGTGLKNTHPFEYKGFYLAHNGVVHYKGEGAAPPFICDSEQFLHWFVDNKLDWNECFNNWRGWGAIGFFDSIQNLLTVAVDGAGLKISRRKNKQGWVMATTDELVAKICHSSELELATNPVTFPRHIANFDKSGEIVSDRSWVGFSNGQWTQQDFAASGGKRNKKKGKHGGAVTIYQGNSMCSIPATSPAHAGNIPEPKVPTPVYIKAEQSGSSEEALKEMFPDYNPRAWQDALESLDGSEDEDNDDAADLKAALEEAELERQAEQDQREEMARKNTINNAISLAGEYAG